MIRLGVCTDVKNINEIAEIIRKSPSAVKMRLQKGRRLLEEAYRKEKQQNGDQ